ncbi:uncharacterized protein LOC135333844 isoform X5 [Halichondria panicea]|uniref:uncharacterized protein LOC135333844 isoform X5 n=1 Tax=Halichondria panicea TaxID=6063 RepID=UPI00312B39F5
MYWQQAMEFPNVGKSSTINALIQCMKVPVSACHSEGGRNTFSVPCGLTNPTACPRGYLWNQTIPHPGRGGPYSTTLYAEELCGAYGCAWYPNVGKSSTINALIQCKKVATPWRLNTFSFHFLLLVYLFAATMNTTTPATEITMFTRK